MTYLHEPTAGICLVAGVDHRHLPRLRKIVVNGDAPAVGEIERHIGIIEVMSSEELFYDVLLVARADDELVEAEMRVDFHDVPEDRAPADLDHRLGDELRLLPDASAQPARQQYYLQCDFSFRSGLGHDGNLILPPLESARTIAGITRSIICVSRPL